ncbi:MAG TPA: hypothetical protein VNM38_02565 [Solirubrobacterales bacterium]|nr:hypothetical protein [Solirubrobacterales bacterium]
MAHAETKTTSRRLLALLGAAVLLAALVAIAPRQADSAPLRVVVLGQTPNTPPPSCPGKYDAAGNPLVECSAEGHVTGFQSVADGIARPYEAPFEGKIVAWSITLSKPSTVKSKSTTDEVGFFNDFFGSPSQARIGILRPVEGSKPPQYKLVRQSPIEILDPYFGTTPIFALDHPLTVLKGQVVALTIPTWAPMFALTGEGNNWRGSRLPGHCVDRPDLQSGHPQQGVGKIKTYGCYYSDARLLYTATLVKKP